MPIQVEPIDEVDIPPITIIATPGAANANSYGTLEEANAYFLARLYSEAFLNADVEKQKAALVMATRMLDDGFLFDGRKTEVTQALKVPRIGLYDADRMIFDFNVIPSVLKEAEFELALSLLQRDRIQESKLKGLGLKSVKVGPIDLEISQDASSSVLDFLPRHVLLKLQSLGALASAGSDGVQFAKVIRT